VTGLFYQQYNYNVLCVYAGQPSVMFLGNVNLTVGLMSTAILAGVLDF